MGDRIPEGWDRPYETSRWFRFSAVYTRIVGYAWAALAIVFGVGFAVGCSLSPARCALPAPRLTGLLIAVVAAVVGGGVFLVVRRFTGSYGVSTSEGGVRLDRMFDTVVHEWGDVARVEVEVFAPVMVPSLVIVCSDGRRWRTFAVGIQVASAVGWWTGQAVDRVREIAAQLDARASGGPPAAPQDISRTSFWRRVFELSPDEGGHPLRRDRARLTAAALFLHPLGFIMLASGQVALTRDQWPGWIQAAAVVAGFLVFLPAVLVLLAAMFWIRPLSPDSRDSAIREMADYLFVLPFSLLLGRDGRRVLEAAGHGVATRIAQRGLMIVAFALLVVIFVSPSGA